MNSIFQMFNDDYIQEQARKAQKAQQEQVENILKSAEKLKDFFDSVEKIEPEYMPDAMTVFCMIIANRKTRHTHPAQWTGGCPAVSCGLPPSSYHR